MANINESWSFFKKCQILYTSLSIKRIRIIKRSSKNANINIEYAFKDKDGWETENKHLE